MPSNWLYIDKMCIRDRCRTIHKFILCTLKIFFGHIFFIVLRNSFLNLFSWFLCRNRFFRNFNSLGRRSCKDCIFKIKFKII